MSDFKDKLIKEFPQVSIKYKDKSLFMKFLGFVLFFNQKFMDRYVTTIGNTIYFPSEKSFDENNLVNHITLLHELVHVIDFKKNLFFSILYLMPQIMFFIGALIGLFISWKIVLISLIFLLPWPAYWRMKYEKRAYTISLYAMQKINVKYNNLFFDLRKEADRIAQQFSGSMYYFMWPLKDIKKYFSDTAELLIAGQKSDLIEEDIYQIIDRLLN